MKQDKLEQFVTQNREEFDDLIPDPKIWDKIQDNIEPTRTIQWKGIIWKAAAVLIIFTASYFFHDFISKNDINNTAIAQDTEEQIDPEEQETVNMLLEAEAYYTAQINTKKAEVFQLAGSNTQLIQDINIEFEELDEVLEDLKKDLNDFTGTEEIIEAMIQNYRLKLMILEDMLYQMKAAEDNNELNDQSYEQQI